MVNGRQSHWHWVVAALISVPVLYLISIPPLAWCDRNGMFPQRTLRYQVLEVYAVPWHFIYERAPNSVQIQMNRYLRLLAGLP